MQISLRASLWPGATCAPRHLCLPAPVGPPATFGAHGDDQILKTIEDLHAKFCPDKTATKDLLSRCKDLETALDTRLKGSSVDYRRYFILREAADLDLKGDIEALRAAGLTLAGAVEPLIAEKLDVLQKVVAFAEKVGDAKQVKCPACGRSIWTDDFQSHITAERERLQEIIPTFAAWKGAIGTLCDTVNALKSSLGKPDVKSWRDDLTNKALTDNFAYLDEMDSEALRASSGVVDVNTLEAKLLPLIAAAASNSKDAPPDAQALTDAKRTTEAGKAAILAKDQAASVARAEALFEFILFLEQGVRKEIKLGAQTVIDEISDDIRAMWAILYPKESIENVGLSLPDDVDKAIDIRLKFFGVEQDSPRLTLSEGYRNGLGLCIFLAMAKRETEEDRPLFLDDVVLSMDRYHRGMIRELLVKQFSKRQVIVLTLDRESFAELRQQLCAELWDFKMLLPYETPDIGIRWSHKTTTFGAARAQVMTRPDSAGNDARKIMDVEISLIAEDLQIRLPYLRGDKNDRRMAHEFLERIVADGKRCFQLKAGIEYAAHTGALSACEEANRLLVSWGNRASHADDLVRPEATKLIDACERALELFKCSSCGTGVGFADAEKSEWTQCQCSQIRWRYGKG